MDFSILFLLRLVGISPREEVSLRFLSILEREFVLDPRGDWLFLFLRETSTVESATVNGFSALGRRLTRLLSGREITNA